jgi:hypothetical protein
MTHFCFCHKPTNQQTNSVQLKPSSYVNRHAASQTIPHIISNPRFTAVFATSHHLSLPWTKLIQSMSSYDLYFKSILIQSFHLITGLPNSLIPSGFPTKIFYSFFFIPICAPCPTHTRLVWYYHPTIWHGVQIMKLPNIFLSVLFSTILMLCVPLNVRNPLKTQKQIPRKGLVSCHILLNVSEWDCGISSFSNVQNHTGLKYAHTMFLLNPTISITKIQS